MYFGVDKRTITNLKLRSIDFEILDENEKVKRSYQGDVVVSVPDKNTGEYRTFSSISVKKGQGFENLTMGCKKNGMKKTEYAKIDIFVDDKEVSNLIPDNVEKAMQKHGEVLEYIEKEYGIELTDREAKYGYLEINGTAELELSSSDYQGVFEALQFIAPSRYKDVDIRRNNDTGEIRFISYDNQSMRLKMYNKTEQLKQFKKVDVIKLYFRMEVCLEDSKKIINVFGTNKVSEITEDILKDYFIQTIKHDVFDRMDEYIEAGNKAIEKKKKALKKASKTGWTAKMCGIADKKMIHNKKRVDMVFDIQQVKDSIRADIKKKSNYDRTMRTHGAELEECEHKKNNLNAYEEIKSKFLSF